jgi:hypothetical protein
MSRQYASATDAFSAGLIGRHVTHTNFLSAISFRLSTQDPTILVMLDIMTHSPGRSPSTGHRRPTQDGKAPSTKRKQKTKSQGRQIPDAFLEGYQQRPSFMFVPMSNEAGGRSKVVAEHRASAKAHVMHDFQRRTAGQRLNSWKMTTPKTYSLAPKTPNMMASDMRQPTSQPVVGWENMTVNKDLPERRVALKIQNVSTSDSSTPVSSQRATNVASTRTFTSSQSSESRFSGLYLQPERNSRLDVFSTMPIDIQAWDQTLIHRWLNYDRIPWCPVNGQSQWIPFVTHSSLLLHTNLYCWGMHWHGKLTGVDSDIFLRENPQILEHKGAAIQMMNEKLASGIGISYELLAAVCIFINVSLQFMDKDEASRHMKGLEAMVRMHGGLDNLSSIGTVGVLLQRMTSWNDLFYVELFGGGLRFSTLPRFEEAFQSTYASVVDDPVTHLEPFQPRFAGDLAQEVTMLLREIQLVCDDLQSRPFDPRTVPEKTVLHDTLLRFERRLCLATRITTLNPNNTTPTLGSLWRAIAYAALMYVHHHIRGHPLHSPQFPALLVHLRHELHLTGDECWHDIPALRIWTLAVGCWVSQGATWTAELLANVCRAMGCFSWEDFQTVLSLGPSLEESDEDKFRAVWGQVVRRL